MILRDREINIFSMSALDLFASALGAFVLLFLILLPYYLKTDPDLITKNQQLNRQNTELNQQNTQLQQQLQTAETQNQQLSEQNTELQQNLTACESQQATLQQQLAECQQQQQNAQQQNAELQRQLQRCQQNAEQARARADSCEEKMRYTFLAIIIQWATSGQDVDLRVIDPAGNEFSYSKSNRNRRDFPNVDAELSVDSTRGPGVEAWQTKHAEPGTYKIYANLYNTNSNDKKPVIYSSVYYRDGGKKLRQVTLTRVLQAKDKLIATIEVKQNGDVVIH